MEIFSVITVIVLCFLITMIVYEKKLLKNLNYKCYFSVSEAYENDEIEFIEEIANSKLIPVPWLKSELTTSKWLEFSQQQSVVTDKTRFVASFFSLRGYSRIKRVWKVKCLKRGNYSVSNIVVVASDIVGFRKQSCTVDMSELTGLSVRVLPLCSDYTPNRTMLSSLIGDAFTKNKLVADPFFSNGIREYTIQDRYQSINWYATAKQQQLMVNKNDFTNDNNVTIFLNIQSTPQDIYNAIYEEYIEKCISLCAAAVYTHIENNNNIRLIANALTHGEKTDVRSSDFTELMRILADIDMSISVDFVKLIDSVISDIKNSCILIISSYTTEALEMIAYQNPFVNIISPDMSGGEKK